MNNRQNVGAPNTWFQSIYANMTIELIFVPSTSRHVGPLATRG